MLYMFKIQRASENYHYYEAVFAILTITCLYAVKAN